MSLIEPLIHQFIAAQFPAIYRDEGPQFIAFVTSYFQYLEASNNALYHTRRLLDYKDIDLTIDDFVIHFKEKYLKNIQADTVVATRRLVKHSLDLYRSKGTERSVDLFFRAVFGQGAEVYYPSDDIFRLSSGDWVKPKYLEVTPSKMNYAFIEKQIEGATSGATAFVERYIRRRIAGKYINVLYISAISGEFQTNEVLNLPGIPVTADNPIVIGSMTTATVLDGGYNFNIGDIVEVISDNGVEGKVRVTGLSVLTGAINFTLDYGGWGYTANPEIIISDHVLQLTNVTANASNYGNSYFNFFEALVQPLANIQYISANGTYSIGDNIFTYYANNLLAGQAVVIGVTTTSANVGEIEVAEVSGNVDVVPNPNANLVGTVKITNGSINVVGIMPNANLTGTIQSVITMTTLDGTSTLFDQELYTVLANNSGTVSVNTTVSNVEGSGTSFTTDFLPGDFIVVFANTTNWQARLVNSIANDIHLSVHGGPFGFTNTTSDYSEGYQNEYITVFGNSTYHETVGIRAVDNATRIELISSLSFSNNAAVFANVAPSGTEFLVQGANLTGTITTTYGNTKVIGSGTVFTTFVPHDFVALWNNSTAYIIKEVESVSSDTTMFMTNAVLFDVSGSQYSPVVANSLISYGTKLIFWSNSTVFESKSVNNISNDTFLTLQTGVHFSNDVTVFGNVTAGYHFYTTANAVGANISVFVDKTATGNVIGVSSNVTMQVSNTLIPFEAGQAVYQTNSTGFETANAVVVGSIGSGVNSVLMVTNSMGIFHPGAQLLMARSNTGVNVSSNGYLDSLALTVGITTISGAFTTDANNMAFGNQGMTNSTISEISAGSLASFKISSTLSNPETINIPLIELLDYVNVQLGATSYGFPTEPTANISSVISDFNTTLTIGGITGLVSVNPGLGYSNPPFVLVREPDIAAFFKKDIKLRVNNATGIFSVGEEITQTGGGLGVVKSANSTAVFVYRISFEDLFNTSDQLVGISSGVTADVVNVFSQPLSTEIGLNALVEANVQVHANSVTSLDVFDSGFGYLDDEDVTFASPDGSSVGLARISLGKKGVSEGYFRDRNGWLSSDKHLYDGDYYQDFSYEVRTAVVEDKYSKMLKDIIHVAGTKLFSAVVLQDVVETNLDIETGTVTVA